MLNGLEERERENKCTERRQRARCSSGLGWAGLDGTGRATRCSPKQKHCRAQQAAGHKHQMGCEAASEQSTEFFQLCFKGTRCLLKCSACVILLIQANSSGSKQIFKGMVLCVVFPCNKLSLRNTYNKSSPSHQVQGMYKSEQIFTRVLAVSSRRRVEIVQDVYVRVSKTTAEVYSSYRQRQVCSAILRELQASGLCIS